MVGVLSRAGGSKSSYDILARQQEQVIFLGRRVGVARARRSNIRPRERLVLGVEYAGTYLVLHALQLWVERHPILQSPLYLYRATSLYPYTFVSAPPSTNVYFSTLRIMFQFPYHPSPPLLHHIFFLRYSLLQPVLIMWS